MLSAFEYGVLYIKRYMRGCTLVLGLGLGLRLGYVFGILWGNPGYVGKALGKPGEVWGFGDMMKKYCTAMCIFYIQHKMVTYTLKS